MSAVTVSAAPGPDSAPRVSMLGATGKVGQNVYAALLERGLTVKVLVRNAAKLDKIKPASTSNPLVTVIEGSVLQDDKMDQLVADCDVIVSCLGMADPNTRVCGPAAQKTVDAVRRAGTKPRIVMLSGIGAGSSKQQIGCCRGGCMHCVMISCLVPCMKGLRVSYADMEDAERILMGAKDSFGGTTIGRSCTFDPSMVKDDKLTGAYYACSADDPPGDWQIHILDTAKFLVDATLDRTWDSIGYVSVFPKKAGQSQEVGQPGYDACK